jgi:ubiquitin-protein ligase
MAANRVWKEYKEISKNGPDAEISLAPIDDSDIFKWAVRAAPPAVAAPAYSVLLRPAGNH